MSLPHIEWQSAFNDYPKPVLPLPLQSRAGDPCFEDSCCHAYVPNLVCSAGPISFATVVQFHPQLSVSTWAIDYSLLEEYIHNPHKTYAVTYSFTKIAAKTIFNLTRKAYTRKVSEDISWSSFHHLQYFSFVCSFTLTPQRKKISLLIIFLLLDWANALNYFLCN